MYISFPEMEGDSNLAHDWRAIGFGDEDGARHEDEIFDNCIDRRAVRSSIACCLIDHHCLFVW